MASSTYTNSAWTEQLSSSGKRYYYNKVTEVSQWEKPEELKQRDRLQEEQRRLSEQQHAQPPPPQPPPFVQPISGAIPYQMPTFVVHTVPPFQYVNAPPPPPPAPNLHFPGHNAAPPPPQTAVINNSYTYTSNNTPQQQQQPQHHVNRHNEHHTTHHRVSVSSAYPEKSQHHQQQPQQQHHHHPQQHHHSQQQQQQPVHMRRPQPQPSSSSASVTHERRKDAVLSLTTNSHSRFEQSTSDPRPKNTVLTVASNGTTDADNQLRASTIKDRLNELVEGGALSGKAFEELKHPTPAVTDPASDRKTKDSRLDNDRHSYQNQSTFQPTRSFQTSANRSLPQTPGVSTPSVSAPTSATTSFSRERPQLAPLSHPTSYHHPPRPDHSQQPTTSSFRTPSVYNTPADTQQNIPQRSSHDVLRTPLSHHTSIEDRSRLKRPPERDRSSFDSRMPKYPRHSFDEEKSTTPQSATPLSTPTISNFAAEANGHSTLPFKATDICSDAEPEYIHPKFDPQLMDRFTKLASKLHISRHDYFKHKIEPLSTALSSVHDFRKARELVARNEIEKFSLRDFEQVKVIESLKHKQKLESLKLEVQSLEHKTVHEEVAKYNSKLPEKERIFFGDNHYPMNGGL